MINYLNQDTVGAGFSWSNIVGMLMQMLLGQGAAGIAGPSKNDIEDGTPSASPWSNLLTVGLKVLSAILGGNQQSVDGIDKVDNQSSPMQVKKNIQQIIFSYLYS